MTFPLPLILPIPPQNYNWNVVINWRTSYVHVVKVVTSLLFFHLRRCKSIQTSLKSESLISTTRRNTHDQATPRSVSVHHTPSGFVPGVRVSGLRMLLGFPTKTTRRCNVETNFISPQPVQIFVKQKHPKMTVVWTEVTRTRQIDSSLPTDRHL